MRMCAQAETYSDTYSVVAGVALRRTWTTKSSRNFECCLWHIESVRVQPDVTGWVVAISEAIPPP